VLVIFPLEAQQFSLLSISQFDRNFSRRHLHLSTAAEETQNELQVVLAYYPLEAQLYITLTIYQNADGFRLNEKLSRPHTLT